MVSRLFGAGTPFQRTRGNVGEIVGVPRKPFPPTVQPEETLVAFELNEKAVVGARGRGDTKRAWAKGSGG